MNKKFYTSFAIFITILSLLWIVLTPVLFKNVDASTKPIAVHKGFTAPDFTLQTPGGEAHSLSDYEGQPVLVFFWASWCSVCKRIMPNLQSVYEDYAPLGFKILAINTSYQDSLATAIETFNSQGYTYTMLIDQNGDLSQKYNLNAVPLSVLVSPNGEIFDVIVGSGMSDGYLRAYLNDIYQQSN